MCRFQAYHGPPLCLDELLYKPDHSIIRQSTDARERPEPLNGDGWGVGWYEPSLSPEPAVYREVRPAWNDENMRRLSPVVKTPLYFAHVRAASPGLAIHQLNCHPFPGGLHTLEDSRHRDDIEEGRQELMFMHNGTLGSYQSVIRQIETDLDQETFLGIRGTTDSEHAFAVVQDRLGEAVVDPSVGDLRAALEDSLEYLEGLKHEHGDPTATTWANFCLSDGESIVATRYASPEDATAQSLYVGEAGSFVTDGEFVGTPDPSDDDATVIASEPLFEDERVWRPVPRDHVVTVEPSGETSIEPLDIDVAKS